MNVMGSQKPMGKAQSVELGDLSGLLRSSVGNRLPVLIQYISILRRRKWLIILSVVGAGLAGLLITLLMTPQYSATTLIEIQRESRNFTNVDGVEPQSNNQVDNEFYETQYGLLKAQSLAERVATDMKLYDNAQFFSMYHDREAAKWFNGGHLINNASPRERRVREAGDVLLDHVSVTPQRLSRLVQVTVRSPDRQFAQQVANSWAQHFIEMALERRYQATSYARQFLEQRLSQLRGRMDQAERQLVDYASREGIVSLPSAVQSSSDTAGVTGERSVVADNLASLNGELSKATADRINAESRLSSSGDAVKEALDNQAISQMRSHRADLASDYAKMLTQFEPNYPPAKALQMQIDKLDQSIMQEQDRIRRTIRQTYQSSVDREGQLTHKVDQLKTGVLDLRRRSIQYNILERDVDTSRQLYDALLQRYKEIGVAGGVGVNNISIVDNAELPEKPSSPKVLLNLIFALLLGFVGGAAAALALEQIDEGIADPGQVEAEVGAPLLGVVPMTTEGVVSDALENRKSPVSEAYISLVTNLAFSTDHGVPRTLAVSSTRAAEGKSITSLAIAQALARTGRRVLLVDADLRAPSAHRLLGLPNERGLSNYLAGEDGIDSLILPTSFANLSAMPSGPHPPNPSELLSSVRFEQLARDLQSKFDHIIFDAPPVLGLADAPLIASRSEGTVFVVEARRTQKGAVRVALGRLRSANADILGITLTKFDPKKASYGYGYGDGYGYSYNYGSS